MKKQFNEAQLAEISALQEKRNITRKSAIHRFEKAGKEIVLTSHLAAAPAQARATNTIPPTLIDVKSRAANDDTNNQLVAATAPAPNKTAAVKPVVPATPAGDARKEGIRLFPTRWQAEEGRLHPCLRTAWSEVDLGCTRKGSWPEHGRRAAARFQAMRAKPAGSCVDVTEETKQSKYVDDRRTMVGKRSSCHQNQAQKIGIAPVRLIDLSRSRNG